MKVIELRGAVMGVDGGANNPDAIQRWATFGPTRLSLGRAKNEGEPSCAFWAGYWGR